MIFFLAVRLCNVIKIYMYIISIYKQRILISTNTNLLILRYPSAISILIHWLYQQVLHNNVTCVFTSTAASAFLAVFSIVLA